MDKELSMGCVPRLFDEYQAATANAFRPDTDRAAVALREIRDRAAAELERVMEPLYAQRAALAYKAPFRTQAEDNALAALEERIQRLLGEPSLRRAAA